MNGQASQGSRFSRWHIEPQREEEQEAWLITYLDMLTLLLVMLVIMLALAGKGDGEQNDPAASAMLAAGELGVALPAPAAPIPSIAPVPTPAADAQPDDPQESMPTTGMALGDDIRSSSTKAASASASAARYSSAPDEPNWRTPGWK